MIPFTVPLSFLPIKAELTDFDLNEELVISVVAEGWKMVITEADSFVIEGISIPNIFLGLILNNSTHLVSGRVGNNVFSTL